MSDYETIIACAVRYALGRRTYIVSTVCDYITLRIDTLSENCLRIMARDIRDQEEFGYGDDCDKRDWMALLDLIDAHIDLRMANEEGMK